jgi:hypothetical protein
MAAAGIDESAHALRHTSQRALYAITRTISFWSPTSSAADIKTPVATRAQTSSNDAPRSKTSSTDRRVTCLPRVPSAASSMVVERCAS